MKWNYIDPAAMYFKTSSTLFLSIMLGPVLIIPVGLRPYLIYFVRKDTDK